MVEDLGEGGATSVGRRLKVRRVGRRGKKSTRKTRSTSTNTSTSTKAATSGAGKRRTEQRLRLCMLMSLVLPTQRDLLMGRYLTMLQTKTGSDCESGEIPTAEDTNGPGLGVKSSW